MNQRLKDKAALVTGAATGIGKATARLLATRGARVAVADIDGAGAAAVAATIVAEGGEAIAVTVDLIEEESIAAMIGEVRRAFGRIDIVHNNAAMQGPHQRDGDRDVASLEVEFWDRAIAVNARGPMLVCKHAIPLMIADGGGAFVHSSSGFGMTGEVTLTAYGASKAALMSLSKMVATQYGKQGIRSNVVVIGFVLTETAISTTPQAIKDMVLDAHLTPYLGDPDHIANAVAFLASDEAAFITGAELLVDGGFLAHSPTVAPFRTFFAAAGSNRL